MKTLLLTLLLAIPCTAQIQQVASSSDNPKGFPIAFFVDKKSVVHKKDMVSLTVIAAGIASWKEEFGLDVSKYFIVSDLVIDCKKKEFAEVRSVGFDGGLISVIWDKPSVKLSEKGSVVDAVINFACTEQKGLRA